MKIIMVRGYSGTGKTTTLKKVRDFLWTEGRIKEGGKVPESDCDIWAIIEYRGKTIGLLTMGDYSNKVLEYAKEFREGYHCDWFICACNSGFTRPIGLLQDSEAGIFLRKENPDDADEKRMLDVIKNILDDEILG